MEKFISTDHGLINTRYIIRILDVAPKSEQRLWYLEGDEVRSAILSGTSEEDFNGTVIPASPGYSVALFWKINPPLTPAFITPIIGWIIRGANLVRPVVLGEELFDDGGKECLWGILLPDDRVLDSGIETYSSIDAFRKACQEQWKKSTKALKTSP